MEERLLLLIPPQLGLTAAIHTQTGEFIRIIFLCSLLGFKCQRIMWGAKPLANCVKPPRVFFSFDDFFCWIPCNAFLFISSMLLFSCACAHTKKLTRSGNHAGGCAWTRLWSHLLCHISHKHSQVWLMLLFFFKIFWSNDHGYLLLQSGFG